MSTDHLQAWFAKAWSAWQTQRPVRHIPVVEEYEPRLLYSADPITAGLALAGPGQVVEQRLVDDAGEFVSSSSTTLQAQERRRELLIVGAGIEDSKTLLDGLESDDREIEVLVLDPSRDSIDQISAALAGRHDLAAIHILSHGASGQLQLGATTLDSAQLTARADEISRWGQALQADGDILLYGCDVAADASGAAFVHQLSALTGADVAASDDLTGDNLLQGDWTLEYTTGAIETALAVNASVQRQWTGVLEARVNTTTAGGQSNAAVAIAPDGSFVVTWASGGGLDGEDSGIFLQRYDAVGNRLGAEVQVNTDFAEEQISPSVGMDANGGFVVTWASDSGNGADDDGWSIRAQRFSADGSKAGVEFVVNKGIKGDQDQPVVSVAADGQFVIAWRSDASSGSDIYVRHFDANGVALRSDVLVVNSDGSQANPAIAINSDGSYVVAWQSNKGGSGKSIFAQRFNSDDSRLGAEFRVNTYDINDQTRPTVATDGNGAFVIAWTSTDQDGSGDGVYAQLFASDGTKAGSEFRVNTYTNNDQDLPAAAMDGNGSFIISWSSRKQDDPASTGIYAQRYSPDGAATGAPVLVNSTVAGRQDSPAVAMNSRGDTVIAWDGNGAADRSGIFMAAYVAANVAPSAKLDIVITDQITSVNSTAPGVLANDIDPEGSPLVVQGILAGATGAPVAVTAAGVTITGAYGELFIRSDGSYVYTPNSTTARGLAAGQSADDLFTYVISDDKNASASSTLTFVVQGVNDAPVANDNIYVVDKLGTLNVAARGVLANDADPDVAPVPDVLTVSAINDMSNKVGAALYGSYGTLTLRADGSLHYAPDLLNVLVRSLLSGQQLVDAFSYSISDGNGGIARAMVKINIVSPNSAPAATDDSGYVVQEDGVLAVPVAGGVLANDTDLDGNALSAVLASGPAHGRLVVNQDGSFVYTPDPLYHGADSFTYRASDGSLNSSLATVLLTVTHVNHAPVVQDDDAFIMQDNVLLVSAANGLLANDTEPDASDTLAITGIRVGNTFIPVVAGSPTIIVTDYGTLEVASDGSYSYVSDGAASKSLGAGSISNDVFTYTVSDGQGGTATAELAIRITGSNDAPAVSGVVANQSTDDKASTTPFSNVIIGDVDSPSQTLTVTITLDLPAKGMLSNLSGGTYDAATGVFSFTGSAVKVTAAVRGLVFAPTENRVTPGLTETTALAITVNDGIAATTDVTTTVVTTSINDAPGISGAVAVQAVADNAVLNPFSTVTFGDADNPSQPLTVRITIDATVKGKLSNLGGGAYDYATGTYSFTGSAAQATAVVPALVFTPTENRVTPGSSETAAFAITVKDGIAETDVRITV
ncbi:MAG: tandem-95 repeat protein, partial [Burkholderia sp.]|nr:tandem-95 repeat protein [Burkholderia sp.]